MPTMPETIQAAATDETLVIETMHEVRNLAPEVMAQLLMHFVQENDLDIFEAPQAFSIERGSYFAKVAQAMGPDYMPRLRHVAAYMAYEA